MTVTLRPLDDEGVAEVAPEIERLYAEEIERNGGLPAADATRKAAQDVPPLIAAPDSDLFAVDADGETVGRLWIGEREVQGRRMLFVWEVFIGEQHRGRGFGREAMVLAEDEARRRGLDRIELNVFGRNEVARGLYRSLGYEEFAVAMGKTVS
jgi:ribosomal protein S18 acetylase RimI-like enzyme